LRHLATPATRRQYTLYMSTPLTLDWLHLAVLLGAVQGVFLAASLATKRRNRTANRVLAVAMLVFSVSLATTVYHAGGYVSRFPDFFGVGYPLPFLFGPLVYLYAVTAADRTRGLRRYDALHFLPFAVVVIAGMPIYLLSGTEKIALFAQLQDGERPLLLAIADPLKFVSGIGYALVTIAFLRRHRERVKDSYSTTERVNLRWLLLLGLSSAGIWLLAIAFQLLDVTGLARIERADDVISLAVAALVYAIGYMGLRQPEVFRFETAEYAIPAELAARATRSAPAALAPAPAPTPERQSTSSATPTLELPSGAPPPDSPLESSPAAQTPGTSRESSEPTASTDRAERDDDLTAAPTRYERSGLSERQARRLADALVALMETERPWRDSELTLADLAARLSTTPHRLSEVLNSQIGLSFYDFVNGYRVREVQRRIVAGDADRLTMLSLALDAGFASKSTFNQVFKKHTNRTPSDYRQTAGV
jgi:AraC-like DNA-binding protein